MKNPTGETSKQTLIPPFSALNGTINYKTHIMLYSARLENSARANKLIRIMSRVRIIGIQSHRPLLVSRDTAGLRHQLSDIQQIVGLQSL